MRACAHACAGPSSAGGIGGAKRAGGSKDGFEIVPQQKQRKKGDDSDGSGTDSDDEFDALDDQVRARWTTRCTHMAQCGVSGASDAFVDQGRASGATWHILSARGTLDCTV